MLVVLMTTLLGSSLGLGFGGAPAFAAPLPASEPEPAPVAAPAPLCDPLGASIAARPEMDLPIVDRGRVEELPCDALAALRRQLAAEGVDDVAFGAPERPEPTPREARAHTESACELAAPYVPLRSEPSEIGRERTQDLAPSAGHWRGVFRPPVLSA